MKIKIIACEVIKDELLSVHPAYDTNFSFIPMGLHLHPDKLNKELQKQLDASQGYTHIILAFGLCGGAARKLKSKGSIMVIPKVHDCIPLLLGSGKAFERIRNEESGTFYYSCGWFKGNNTFLSDYERLSEKCGEKEALEIIRYIYDSFRNVVFIKTGHSDENVCIEKAMKMAELLNLRFITVTGQKRYIEKLVRGPWNDDEFITLTPGSELDDTMFF